MKVRIRERRGPTVLIEWDDGQRHWGLLPAESVENDEVDEEELARAVPIGLDYERLIKISLTPEAIAEELRGRGYWTVEDLERNWSHVQRVFAKTAYQDAANMYEAARRAK